MKNRPDLEKLQEFNITVLQQARDLVAAHRDLEPLSFAQFTGPHLRHIIEHYEAFVRHIDERSIDYDTRQRELAVERDLDLADQRLLALQKHMQQLALDSLEEPVAVHLRAGLAGEDNIVSFSSAARELLFLASHATHHFALIKLRGAEFGLELDENFGKAPSTVRHANGI